MHGAYGELIVYWGFAFCPLLLSELVHTYSLCSFINLPVLFCPLLVLYFFLTAIVLGNLAETHMKGFPRADPIAPLILLGAPCEAGFSEQTCNHIYVSRRLSAFSEIKPWLFLSAVPRSLRTGQGSVTSSATRRSDKIRRANAAKGFKVLVAPLFFELSLIFSASA